MEISNQQAFEPLLQTFLKHLKLQGLQPKTIEAYAHGLSQMALNFGHLIDNLSSEDLTNYFHHLLKSHSFSTVKHSLYAYKFYVTHVLRRPWDIPKLIKAPREQRLPDILTIEQVQTVLDATRILSFRVFFFTLYSLGLRLSEGLALTVADIDAQRHRVHIRNSKGNKDRFVPLSDATLVALRRFWSTHRNQSLLFPSRQGGAQYASITTESLDPASIQKALHRVCSDVGIKLHITPHSLRHTYATHLIETGVDILQVQRILGHSSIKTTARYTHLTTVTHEQAQARIGALMGRFTIKWGQWGGNK